MGHSPSMSVSLGEHAGLPLDERERPASLTSPVSSDCLLVMDLCAACRGGLCHCHEQKSQDSIKDKSTSEAPPGERGTWWCWIRWPPPEVRAEAGTDNGPGWIALAPEDTDAPDGGWGWLVTFAAFIIMCLATLPAINFGVMFSSFLLEMNTSTTMSFWIFSLALVNSNLTSTFIRPLVEEFGWRKMAFVSGLVFGAGIIMSAFATSASFLIFSFSTVAGFNMKLLVSIAYLVIPQYFSRWRNVANSIMTTGSSISQMVMPPLITYLQEEYGFRGATLITGALILNCCVAAMVLHPVQWHRRARYYKRIPEHNRPYCKEITDHNETYCKDIPERRETYCKDIPERSETYCKDIPEQRETYCKEKDCSAETNDQQPNVLWRILSTFTHNLKFFRSPLVVIISVMIGINSVIIIIVFNFVPFVMSRDGFSRLDSSVCLSMAGGCDLVFRLLTAFLSCCPGMRALNVYRFGTLVAMVGTAGFSMVESWVGMTVTLGLVGIGNGLVVSLYSVVIVEELGLFMLLPTLGITGITSGGLFLILSALAGVIRDATDSYMASLVFCACGLFFSFLLSFLTVPALAFERQRNHKDQLTQQPSQMEHKNPLSQILEHIRHPRQNVTKSEKLPFHHRSNYFTQ